MAVLLCPRCGQSLGYSGCAGCGHPAADDDNAISAELKRQELFVAFKLSSIVAASNPLERLRVEQRAAVARTNVVTHLPVGAAVPAAPPVPVSEVRRPVARPQRPSPAPAPVFDAVAARAQLERRLELGGWFTGAVFAVGGSLWGTNLFWGDIPAALRPAVVGAGLAAFATAFIALGAVLAVRHAGSLAGQVLGLVGRLIAVSSIFPLGWLWGEAVPIALAVDVALMGVLMGALRFGARKTQSTKDSNVGSLLFVGGYALAVAAPASEVGAVLVGACAIALFRVGVAGRTDGALSGRPTWVDDIAGLALALAALISDRGAGVDVVVGVTLASGFTNTVARLVEQRPGLFGIRLLARISIGSLAFVLAAVAAVSSLDAQHHLGFAAIAIAIAASHFEGLRAFRSVFAAGMALSVGFGAAGLQQAMGVAFDDVGPLAVLLGLLTLFVTTSPERRAAQLGLGQRLATLALFLSAVPVAQAAGSDLGAVPSLLVVFFLFGTDRRAERSTWWCLVAVSVLLMTLGAALDGVAVQGLTLGLGPQVAAAVALLAVGTLALLVVRQQRPSWPLVAASSAVLLWLLVLGWVGLADAGADGSWWTALVAGLTLMLVAELVRSVDLAIWSALVLGPWGVLRLRAFELPPLVAVTVVVVVLAALTFVPSLPRRVFGLRSLHLLTPGLVRAGRSPRARRTAARGRRSLLQAHDDEDVAPCRARDVA